MVPASFEKRGHFLGCLFQLFAGSACQFEIELVFVAVENGLEAAEWTVIGEVKGKGVLAAAYGDLFRGRVVMDIEISVVASIEGGELCSRSDEFRDHLFRDGFEGGIFIPGFAPNDPGRNQIQTAIEDTKQIRVVFGPQRKMPLGNLKARFENLSVDGDFDFVQPCTQLLEWNAGDGWLKTRLAVGGFLGPLDPDGDIASLDGAHVNEFRIGT